ncbi:MAG: MFS transporter [Pseudomonadota bacterium]|nr:MFS transporter [Pseudomonadota bacterium]MDE3037331.1 MFS transporter [Pseudomonadota bacterium]
MADTMSKIPKSIWALGFVSLFMDCSSELIHSLLPVFMITTLSLSAVSLGIVEGVAEATALITRIFSGALSDWLGKRKLLALMGYGLAAASKPLFPLAHSMMTVLLARCIDRVGKGIRGAPRDALIGDLAPPDIRGACFGLRQSLDTIGAVIGPGLAILFMLLLADHIRAVLWIAAIPAFIAVMLLTAFVREPETAPKKHTGEKLRLRDISRAGGAYWELVAAAAALTLARFSEAFLILKAQVDGLPVAWVPVTLVVMNIVYTLASYPTGKWSDRIGREAVLLMGIAFLLAADMVLGLGHNLWWLALGVSLWGLHMGFTQGLLAAMVTDTAPAHIRGTAYGVYNLACGIAMLAASVIAGEMWEQLSPAATFFTGAFFSAAALAGVGWAGNKRNRHAK